MTVPAIDVVYAAVFRYTDDAYDWEYVVWVDDRVRFRTSYPDLAHLGDLRVVDEDAD